MILDNISYNDNILLDNNYVYYNYRQRLYLTRTYLKSNSQDQYFIKAYILDDGVLKCQGYIYFYLDFLRKASNFIGIYIKEEYRNSGLASLLTSNWLKLCLDNGIYNIGTNKKQRKPFLLYLLKKYRFELKDSQEYQKSFYNIHICQSQNNSNKCLMFDNPNQERAFLNSSFMKEDNYQIISPFDKDAIILDDVILSHLYFLQDEDYAYQKSLQTIEQHR